MQTFTGRQYLQIDIANNFGLDKLTWDERLAWFDKNKDNLYELVHAADEPALFYAGITAYRDVLAGKPIGYMVSLDATSSGLQLLAALTGDRSAARLCNVVDTGRRADAYTQIYDLMLADIGEDGKITRDDTKQAIMTALYGSTAMPKQIFGENALLDVFYNTMKRVAPAAWELNEAFLSMWDPEALVNEWVLPDNFHVKVKVMDRVKEKVQFLNQPFDIFYNVNQPIEEGRSLGANTTHSVDGMIVRELGRRCDYNPVMIENLRQVIADGNGISPLSESLTEDDNLVLTLWNHYTESGYLSARILQHLNADNIGYVDAGVISDLIESLPKKPFKVVSIHDCFRCLPHYANDLRMQYNIQLQLIAQSNLLGYLISQIVGKKVNVGKLDPSLSEDILATNYALS